MNNFKDMLDKISDMGIFAVERDNYEVLYYNKRTRAFLPDIALGQKCGEAYPCLYKSDLLSDMDNEKENRALIYGLPEYNEISATAIKIMWNGEIPAYMISLLPIGGYGASSYECKLIRERNKAVLEKELSEKAVLALISQLNPHFIFNALNTIKGLTVFDKERAGEIINIFSKYLRASINAVTKKKPIAFSKEIEHIKNYLSIEMERFPKIVVEYFVEEDELLVPPMSVQPIVENAVVHGICRKKEGGIIKISSQRKDGFFLITVADTGAGFDFPWERAVSGGTNSLSNIGYRLDALMGGELEIESEKGVGTSVRIKIPVE